MNPAKFEYFVPESLEEALGLFQELGEKARILAGGTDIMVGIRHGRAAPGALIDIKKIPGLGKISFDRREGLTIGATALLADVAVHPHILRKYPAVAYAARETANTQIRNKGTVAGNICNAAPSADNAPTLVVMGAKAIVAGPEGARDIKLDEFFRGPGTTSMKTGEILTAISVPVPPADSGTSYQHISARGRVDISSASAAVMVIMEKNRCRGARICLGAVAPTPMRAVKTEGLLRGKAISRELLREAGLQASRECKPISDVRASAAYRKRMISVLVKRALEEAVKRAKGTGGKA